MEVLTFDCYGTLIDWEAGILKAVRPLVPTDTPDEALLEAYARAESAAEAGAWLPYRDVLRRALAQTCREFGSAPTPKQLEAFGASVADWPAFPDSAHALRRLATKFELGVITNCDDDLFAHSNRLLGEPFKWIVTAEQLRSYKPNARNFEVALARIGRPRERIVHVAQSLFHDHVPAQRMGLKTVWINRRSNRPGTGATPPAAAEPDLAFPDMASFAEWAMDDRATDRHPGRLSGADQRP